MADLDEIGRKRRERHNLLIALKETVEGILAIGSTNVWNTYGGLSRLCRDVENVLLHGLRGTQGSDAACLDYWSYVKGLRWLNPVLAPTIERITRLAKNDPNELTRGQLWIRQCLLDHSLSIKLMILVKNRQHLEEHYTDDAFLCRKEYYEAMAICLQAVEQNKVALLAEVNPNLLKLDEKKILHVRSASLPVNKPSTPAIMVRRKSSLDPLAPPFSSPKRDGVFLSVSPSKEYAQATSNGGSSLADGKITARSQLLTVLKKSGDIVQIETTNDDLNFDFNPGLDPLLNIEVSKTKKSASERRKLSIDDLNWYEKSIERSSSVRSDGKNSELLDKILNNDYDIREENDSSDDSTEQNGHLVTTRTSLLSFIDYSSNSMIDLKRVPESCEESFEESGNQSVNDSDVTKSHRHKMESAIAKKKSQAMHKRSKSDHALARAIESPPRSQDVDGDDTLGLSSSRALKILEDDDTYFPRPKEGQSLRSFLASQDFNTCAELDKENAHFGICDAMISAIEEVKWNRSNKPDAISDINERDTDDERREPHQRIRIRRRREKLNEKATVLPSSDGRTDATPSTSASMNQDAIAWTDSMDSSEPDEQDIDIHVNGRASPTTNLMVLKETGLSLSLGSLYSEAELQKTAANKTAYMENNPKPEGSSNKSSCISAAEVALNLLKNFSDDELPLASELEWLVSKSDVPQSLLPVPDSFPISPDDGECQLTTKTRIRGNLEWAPPRAQIIFNIHPPPKRKVLLAKQNYRCTGCGTKVDQGYLKRLQYCEYLGKYFCQCCHSNVTFVIPGKILWKWDFSKYSVSNFSKDLLTKISDEPLFNISDINPALYRKVRALEMIRECRVQLYHIYLFVKTCRMASEILDDLNRLPSHWISEPELYSLADLDKVKNSKILPDLRNLVTDSVCHISACELCQAKGFICELCNNETDLLFPFELNRVAQCRVCSACYHGSCYVPEKCPRCARIKLRRERLAAVYTLSSPEESGPDSPERVVVEQKKS